MTAKEASQLSVVITPSAATNKTISIQELLTLKTSASATLKANHNPADAYGHTYTFTASNAKLLLESGADTTLKNDEGKTALDISKEEDAKEIVELLKNYGK
jgi:replication initiation and membrane attachment protein DnaB